MQVIHGSRLIAGQSVHLSAADCSELRLRVWQPILTAAPLLRLREDAQLHLPFGPIGDPPLNGAPPYSANGSMPDLPIATCRA